MNHEEWLERHDLELWLTNSKVKPAKKACVKACGKISASGFKKLRDENCQYWKCMKRSAPSRADGLLSHEWDQLQRFNRRVLKEFGDELKRIDAASPVSIAMLISSMGFRTNHRQVSGLPSRHRWWEQAY